MSKKYLGFSVADKTLTITTTIMMKTQNCSPLKWNNCIWMWLFLSIVLCTSHGSEEMNNKKTLSHYGHFGLAHTLCSIANVHFMLVLVRWKALFMYVLHYSICKCMQDVFDWVTLNSRIEQVNLGVFVCNGFIFSVCVCVCVCLYTLSLFVANMKNEQIKPSSLLM